MPDDVKPATDKTCTRCEGAGDAYGADRPFEWSGPWSYPGPCPKCGGTGVETEAAKVGQRLFAMLRAAEAERDRLWEDMRRIWPLLRSAEEPRNSSSIEKIRRITRAALEDRPSA